DKYTTVHYSDGKTVLNDSLVDLERRFPDAFLRVHRNTLVAISRIRGLQKSSGGRNLLLLEGTDFQPEVSRRQLSAVRRFIKEQM
ncbi:MAG: LytTR family transcriptional regulator, partial [Xanthomonadales bacterium]|nr:LytTR family transcriptional regulator [Xanthomonadales bacterium]